MADTLHIQLLGDVQLLLNGKPLHAFESPRLHELVAFLVMHQDAPQRRQQVAFTFWPDSSEKQALTNLRKALFLLRKQLPVADAFLHIDRQYLWWRADAPTTADVLQFRHELAAAEREQNPAIVRSRLARGPSKRAPTGHAAAFSMY